MPRTLLLLLVLLAPARVVGDPLAELTQLAEGALRGENVRRAVSGFEVLVLRQGELVYHRAFGDWQLDQVAKCDSSTKTLSGGLVMSLCETGEQGFSLDSHLADFLPAFKKPGLKDVTIRQAFSHTSGISGKELFSPALRSGRLTLRQAAARISRTPIEHAPPGSAFAYGGLSMQATGAAIEAAAGKPFVDLFAERITGPLEMKHTRFYIASQQNPRIAGGVESTATDFGRYMDMLLNEGTDRTTGKRVLRPGSVHTMLTRQTRDDQPTEYSPSDNNRYGIGVWLEQLGKYGPSVDALAGGARGFHAWIDRSHGLVLVFATDRTRFANVEQLSSKMHAALVAKRAAKTTE